ncbi:MAG: NDP-sugar synthase, partial [Pseudomonadota bacterium]
MKVMILAAGLGTRLRPLTLERAKPAIPLLGKPLMVRLILNLLDQGAQSFRINLHHLPHTIEELFDEPSWSRLPVSFSHEPRILGTAGGLKANEAFFDQGTFLMANGDIVLDASLKDAVAFHRERGALATLILFPQSAPFRHYPMRIDDEFRLAHFKGFVSGRPLRPETYVFTGVHILEPEIFEYISPATFSSITDEAYVNALNHGKPVLGYPVDGYWNDLGDPRRYLEVQRDLLSASGRNPSVVLSPEARVHASSRVGP